jgi:hypothetical protein
MFLYKRFEFGRLRPQYLALTGGGGAISLKAARILVPELMKLMSLPTLSYYWHREAVRVGGNWRRGKFKGWTI